jgi:hypothetical protein
MEPFFRKKSRKQFFLTQSPDYCLSRDKNRVLIMERWFQSRNPPDLELMSRLRDKYKTVIFMDGQPDAGTHGLELLPYVDRLFHKSIFIDKKNYQKDLYAKNLFADYYHKKYHIEDTKPEYHIKHAITLKDAERIELSWNIGVGDYPRRHWPQRMGVILARAGFPGIGRLFKTGNRNPPSGFSEQNRPMAVHARIDPVTSESVAHQRRLYLEKISGDPSFITGMVSQSVYYKELKKSKIVLSPFGWGEVCFRDFEAIISGAMLLKPDMSHLRTWPDIYIPYETYVPTNWDGTDIQEKAGLYLANHKERGRIAQNAWEQYQKELNGLEERFTSLFQDVLS